MDLHDFFFAPVPAKLAMALDLHARFGARLAAAPPVVFLIAKIEEAAAGLQQAMDAMAMAALCRECGSRPAGGCCSLEMANETDAVLFLANLLLGVPVTVQREDGRECSFLGPRSCILRLKPIFCLNYNCAAIRTGNTPSAMAALERAAGRLLTLQTELEAAILEQLLSTNELG
ncbi:MAG: hypothetical protein M0017_01560 [Desulfobacteraceae bacterium]|nr:hypothetical protein [Desulfobacteraceae bacterium]